VAGFVIGSSGCAAQTEAVAQDDAPAQVEAPRVALLKTPDGGIQPQAALDSKGVLHLIYYKGKPMAGDVFYVRRKPDEAAFSAPLRVNDRPDSAIAMGTIRGAQITIGQNDRVHVVWNGTNGAEPQGAGGNPILYSHLNDTSTAFAPQRNLITWAGGIDGGAAIAADAKGHVYVAWHAAPAGQEDAARVVYLTRSNDNGDTFEREKKINVQPTGACACCQMRALVDAKGTLHILYRAAGDNVNRDSMLLTSRDAGRSFQSATLHKWKIAACPMSSYALTESDETVRAAWETNEQIFHGAIQSEAAVQAAPMKIPTPVAAPGNGDNRKHPVAVFNVGGELLLAWTESTGWNKGGSLAWQVYDKEGRPTPEKGRAEGVPVWGLLSAIARPDGGFVLIH